MAMISITKLTSIAFILTVCFSVMATGQERKPLFENPATTNEDTRLAEMANAALNRFQDKNASPSERVRDLAKLRYLKSEQFLNAMKALEKVAKNDQEPFVVRDSAYRTLATLSPPQAVQVGSTILEQTSRGSEMHKSILNDLGYIVHFARESPEARASAEEVLVNEFLSAPEAMPALTAYFTKRGHPKAIEVCANAIRNDSKEGITQAMGLKYLGSADPRKVPYTYLLPALKSQDPNIKRLWVAAAGPHPESVKDIRLLYTNSEQDEVVREKCAEMLATYDVGFPEIALKVLKDDASNEYIKGQSLQQVSRALRVGAYGKATEVGSAKWNEGWKKIESQYKNYGSSTNDAALKEGIKELLNESIRIERRQLDLDGAGGRIKIKGGSLETAFDSLGSSDNLNADSLVGEKPNAGLSDLGSGK